MCITSGLCDAGDLFIQVILLLSSPGETPLTLFRQQVHTYYRLRLIQLVITPTLAILHYYTNLIIESIRPH